MNVGDFLFSVWDVSKEIPDIDEMLDRNRNDEPPLASDGLCEECFDIVLTKCCGDESAGEREKQYIMKNEAERSYRVVEQYWG